MSAVDEYRNVCAMPTEQVAKLTRHAMWIESALADAAIAELEAELAEALKNCTVINTYIGEKTIDSITPQIDGEWVEFVPREKLEQAEAELAKYKWMLDHASEFYIGDSYWSVDGIEDTRRELERRWAERGTE